MVFKFYTAVSFINLKAMQANKLANVCLVTQFFYFFFADPRRKRTTLSIVIRESSIMKITLKIQYGSKSMKYKF